MARKDQFLYYMQHGRNGRIQEDMSDAIAEALERTETTGKASKVKLEITISLKGDQFSLHDSIKTNLPEQDKAPTVMFLDPGNISLTRHDPHQRELDLNEAPPDAGPLQDAVRGTTEGD